MSILNYLILASTGKSLASTSYQPLSTYFLLSTLVNVISRVVNVELTCRCDCPFTAYAGFLL